MKKRSLVMLTALSFVVGLSALSYAIEEPVSVEIKTDKAVYAPGETIYYQIEINNESDGYVAVGGADNNVITVRFDLATDVYGRTRNHHSEVNGTNHPSNDGAYSKSRASVAYGSMVLSVPPYGNPAGPLSPVDPGPYFVKATLPLNIAGTEAEVRARTVIRVIAPQDEDDTIDDVGNDIQNSFDTNSRGK
ncbi:MAG: hypothetical protein WC676_05365 [Candidatus Omnitrophota bacterium]